MSFDLDQFEKEVSFDFEKTFLLEIRNPLTGTPSGLEVEIASYRSERVKRLQRKFTNQTLTEQKRNPKKVTTSEEIEERSNDVIVTSIVSWNMERSGVPVPCDPKTVLSILADPKYFYIMEQIDKAADEEKNFTTTSRKK